MRFHQPVGVLQRNPVVSQIGHNFNNATTQNNGNHTEIINTLSTVNSTELISDSITTNSTTNSSTTNATLTSVSSDYFDNDNDDNTNNTVTSNEIVKYCNNTNKFGDTLTTTTTVSATADSNTRNIDEVQNFTQLNLRNNYNNYQLNNVNESYLKLHKQQQQLRNGNEVIKYQIKNRVNEISYNNRVGNGERVLDEDTLSQLITTAYSGTNQTYNDNLNNIQPGFGRACRDNLTKLDLQDTNRIHRHHDNEADDTLAALTDGLVVNTKKNGGTKQTNKVYSSDESSPDDSYLEEEEEEEEEDDEEEEDEDIGEVDVDEEDEVDEDEGNRSPLHSSCASLHSSPPNFTRGIINPNYPGFQHLAHTLSEHFTDHNFEHSSSDSETSEEFEIELTNDFDNNNNNNNEEEDDEEEEQEDDEMEENQIGFQDNGNVNSDEEETESHIAEESNKNLLLKLEPKIYCEKNFEIKLTNNHQTIQEDAVTNVDVLAGKIPENLSETNGPFEIAPDSDNKAQNFNNLEIFEKISCDLATYLKQYQTPNDLACIKDEELDSFIYQKENVLEQDEIGETSPKQQTPDILLKNDIKSDMNTNPSNGDEKFLGFQPDLLSNISNQIDPSISQPPQSPPTSLSLTSPVVESLSSRKQFSATPPSAQIIPSRDGCNDFVSPSSSDVKEESKNDGTCLASTPLLSPQPPPPPPLPPFSLLRIPPSSSINITTTAATQSLNSNLIKSPLNDYSIRSTTPIDIVGDFGREIEREIGLIVSGYNQAASVDVTDGGGRYIKHGSGVNDESVILESKCNEAADVTVAVMKTMEKEKMLSDAVLSNAKETIPLPTQKHFRRDHNNIVKDIAAAVVDIVDNERNRKTHMNSDLIRSVEDNLVDHLSQTVKVEDGTTNCDKKTSESLKPVGLATTATAIPTAIVKPKYQRSSYDDRQLPPVGCINERCLSYHPNFTGDYLYKKPIQQLPHFERKSTNTRIIIPLTSSSSSSSSSALVTKYQNHDRKIHFMGTNEKELINSKLNQYEKDVDCTGSRRSGSHSSGVTSGNTIAIVQPRKKDKMEINLMEKRNKNYHHQHRGGAGGGGNGPRSPNSANNKIHISTTTNNNNSNNISGYNNNNNNNSSFTKALVLSKEKEMKTTANTPHSTLMSSRGGCANVESKEKGGKYSKESISANFDVYNIETALPVIDLEAIENHLKAAREEERRRRNDREEIRRRLAMGDDQEYFKRSAAMPGDKPARKPSLQSRLQNGMNLQICFMNETVSDNESPSSDSETCPNLTKSKSTTQNYTSNSSFNNPYSSRPLSVSKKANINGNKTPVVAGTKKNPTRPASLSLGPPISDDDGSDFFTKQARLQIEARMALSQAKDMAHMQMEIERQKQKQSPITEVIRNSLEKVGINLPAEKRRVSRQMLTDMNIAQLQIIVNELHTQIEVLNENLVEYLMERDDLHMSQDSMLVDIEDLTRYLGAKEQTRNPSTKPLPLSSSTSSLKSKTLQLKASQIGSGTHLPSSNSTILELSQNDNKSPRSSSTSNISSLTTNQTSTTAALSSSPSSHSQLLQNKFLRIANLVKK